jgi:C1A family cysteine protease
VNEFETGDRVRVDGLRKDVLGTVVTYTPAQGKHHAVCVVDWDDSDRARTVWASDLVKVNS